jgi:hypothetical protein
MPLAVGHTLWFEQDGAPAHCGEDVPQWLNAKCLGMWTGRHGPTACPPRSPDLTPMNFFLWGHLKKHVYVVLPGLWLSKISWQDLSSCDNGRWQHVTASSRQCRVSRCSLPRNGRRPFRAPIVTMRFPWFDHQIASVTHQWRVSWKLKVTGHTYITQYFRFFNKESKCRNSITHFHLQWNKNRSQPLLYFKMSLKSHLIAKCFDLTRLSSGNYSLVETATLHRFVCQCIPC